MISIESSFGGLPIVSIADEPNVVIEVMGKDRRKRKTTSEALVQLLDGATEENRRLRAAARAAYQAGRFATTPLETLYDDQD